MWLRVAIHRTPELGILKLTHLLLLLLALNPRSRPGWHVLWISEVAGHGDRCAYEIE